MESTEQKITRLETIKKNLESSVENYIQETYLSTESLNRLERLAANFKALLGDFEAFPLFPLFPNNPSYTAPAWDEAEAEDRRTR